MTSKEITGQSHGVERRTLLAGGAGLALAGCASVPGAGGDPFDGKKLYNDVVTYARWGPHNTAYPADLETAAWLERRLKAAGLRAERSPYQLRQFMLRRAALTIDGRAVDGWPAWVPKATGRAPLNGPLKSGATGGRGDIAVLYQTDNRLAPHAADFQRLAAAGAAGVVLVSATPSGEVYATGITPLPLPIFMVGAKHKPMIDAAVARGAPASLLIDGDDVPNVTAYEVIGRLDRGPRRIVVSTPYSAYLTAAGERGTGLAVWIALAEWASKRPGDTSFTFVASSGHERDAAGIRHFLEHTPPNPKEVKAWLHLGAAVAVREFGRPIDGKPNPTGKQYAGRSITNTPAFASIIQPNFAHLPYQQIQATTAVGEVRLFFEAGYPSWGFEGGNIYHHAPNDLPFVTDPEVLEQAARAIVKTLDEIDKLRP